MIGRKCCIWRGDLSRFNGFGIAVAISRCPRESFNDEDDDIKGSEIEVEKEINNWLAAERINKIRHVTHVNYGTMVYITVWWHRMDAGKNPPMAHGLS